MIEFKGEPTHVVVGYLRDLLEPWVEGLNEDEWGEHLYALWQLLDTCQDFNEARGLQAGIWILEEIQRAYDENWWGTRVTYQDWQPIYGAQDDFEQTTNYWKDRAKAFNGEWALEEAIASLPTWIKPQENRLEKSDPERQEYERLKKKYENG